MSDQEKNGVCVPRFSLRRKSSVVELEVEDGVFHSYTLREMDGTERDKYISGMTSKMKISQDGQRFKLKDMNGLQADLITRCLTGEAGDSIPTQLIQTWPASVLEFLFKKCQELNGLGLEGKTEAKKP